MDDRLWVIGGQSFSKDRPPIIHPSSRGHTLVEVVTVVLVISILACIAVPRLNLAAVWGARADTTVQRLATDLRRARALAITNAARNPEGFALILQSAADPCRSYQITDLHEHRAVTICAFPAGVQCSGGRHFEFGPLGNLQNGSDTHLRVQTEGKAYTIEITPATGAVQWHRSEDKE